MWLKSTYTDGKVFFSELFTEEIEWFKTNRFERGIQHEVIEEIDLSTLRLYREYPGNKFQRGYKTYKLI